ncbi:MAG: TonB family protein [Anderseniella sp.]
MSRFKPVSLAVAIVLSSAVHLMAFAMMPTAPQLDDERASGDQVTISVAVAAASSFPTPQSKTVTEPAMEATAAEVEQPLEPVPAEASEVTNPEMQVAAEAPAAARMTPSQPTEVRSETAPSTTVQVARLSDQLSSARVIESTSTATPVENMSTAEPVQSTDSAQPVENPEAAKPVETTDSAKPVVKAKKKRQSKKKAKARKKPKKTKRRARKNSTARSSASSRRNGVNINNAGSRGKSSRAAGRAKLASYLGRVKSKIRRQNRGAKASGVSVVSFSIAGSGNVVAVRLKRSSGNSTLDKAAVRMVRRAAPFGPLPPDVGRRKLSLSVPIRFRLR